MSDTPVEKLRDAGVIRRVEQVAEDDADFAARFDELFNELSDEEVEMIVSMKQRLDLSIQERGLDIERVYCLVGF